MPKERIDTMIVFISCVKKKKQGVHKAQELYDSTLFNYSLKYAKTLTSNDKIFILSAKYGCLKLDQMIESYDLTLNNMTNEEIKQWSDKVHEQLLEFNIDINEKTVFLTGKKYRKYLSKIFTNSECPVEHLALGKRVQYFKERIDINEK